MAASFGRSEMGVASRLFTRPPLPADRTPIDPAPERRLMSAVGQSEKRLDDPTMSDMALTPDAYADAGEA
jgi:hypothetical protein